MALQPQPLDAGRFTTIFDRFEVQREPPQVLFLSEANEIHPFSTLPTFPPSFPVRTHSNSNSKLNRARKSCPKWNNSLLNSQLMLIHSASSAYSMGYPGNTHHRRRQSCGRLSCCFFCRAHFSHICVETSKSETYASKLRTKEKPKKTRKKVKILHRGSKKKRMKSWKVNYDEWEKHCATRHTQLSNLPLTYMRTINKQENRFINIVWWTNS